MIATAEPEFSRPLTLDEVARQRAPLTVAADRHECAALAKRFGLESLDALSATVVLTPADDAIEAEGRLTASLVQSCVATGDLLPLAIDQAFALRFLPEPPAVAPDDEIELAADDCDVMHYEDSRIDLGEAVAQTLLLSLDPYPRGPNAEGFLKAKGVKSEAEAGPFGALAALKDTLGKD